MTEKPRVRCPVCAGPSRKAIPLCGVVVRRSSPPPRFVDKLKRTAEAHRDLKENYGVEKVCPLGGSSFADVYREIKSRGSFVREKMLAKREESNRETRRRSKEWRRDAMRRSPERTREMLARKRKREKKESISISG